MSGLVGNVASWGCPYPPREQGKWWRNASPYVQYVQLQQLKSAIIQCIHVTVQIFSFKIPSSLSPVGPKGSESSAPGNPRLTGGFWVPTRRVSVRNDCHFENNLVLKLLRRKFQNLEEVCYTNHFVSKLLTGWWDSAGAVRRAPQDSCALLQALGPCCLTTAIAANLLRSEVICKLNFSVSRQKAFDDLTYVITEDKSRNIVNPRVGWSLRGVIGDLINAYKYLKGGC